MKPTRTQMVEFCTLQIVKNDPRHTPKYVCMMKAIRDELAERDQLVEDAIRTIKSFVDDFGRVFRDDDPDNPYNLAESFLAKAQQRTEKA